MLKYTVSVQTAKRKKKRAEALFYLCLELVGSPSLLRYLRVKYACFLEPELHINLLVNKQKNKSFSALIQIILSN